MSVQDKKRIRKKKRFGKVIEYVSYERKIIPDEQTLKNIEKDATRIRGVTPQSLADKYDVAVSTTKSILKRLEEEGKIKKIASTKWGDAYTPA